jgi:hypothetical protein
MLLKPIKPNYRPKMVIEKPLNYTYSKLLKIKTLELFIILELA